MISDTILKAYLEGGRDIVVTGVDGSGKSTMLSKWIAEYDYYRFLMQPSYDYEEIFERYRLFDRCPFLDHYAYNYNSDDSLLIIRDQVQSYLNDKIIIFMLDDKFLNRKTDMADVEYMSCNSPSERKERYYRLAKLVCEWITEGTVIIDSEEGIEYYPARRRILDMDDKEIKTNLTERELYIRESRLYYSGRPTSLSDEKYDELEQRVLSENPQFDIFDHIEVPRNANKIKHMFDLVNMKPPKHKLEKRELIKLKDGPYIYTPKWDGSSIIAYYGCGKLKYILSQHNREEGILQVEKFEPFFPATVDPKVKAIRAEVLHPEKREKANGIVNSKFKYDEIKDDIEVRPFDVITKPAMAYPRRMELAGIEYRTLSIDEVIRFVEKNEEFPTIDGLGADGIVVYGKQNPTYVEIHKFYHSKSVKSEIVEVEFNPSDKSGLFVPKFRVKPVTLMGRTIRRIAANNLDDMRERGLGVGSKVEIALSGMTIPQIIDNSGRTEEPDPRCPFCKSEIVKEKFGLVCSSGTCSWYLRRISEKLSANLVPHKGDEYVTELVKTWKNKKSTGIEDLRREFREAGIDLREKLNNPEEILYAVDIPRLKEENYDRIIRTASSGKLSDLLKAGENYLTELQTEFLTTFYEKIMSYKEVYYDL